MLGMFSLLAALAACGPKQAGQDAGEVQTAGTTDSATAGATDGATSGVTDGVTDPSSPSDPTAPTSLTSGEPQTSGSGSGEDMSGTCPGGKLLSAQIAYTEADVPAGQDPTVGLDGFTTGPSELEPGTLILLFSNQAVTCADPQAELDCPRDSVSLLLPPELQTPGIYTLNDDERHGFSIRAHEQNDTDGLECGYGASTLVGDFEITSIDSESVRGWFCVRTTGGSAPMGGEFTATRCS